MMRNIFQISLLLLILPWGLNAQDHQKYDISIAGISIGEMTATKKVNGEDSQIDVKSKVGFWFFGKIELDYHTVSVFKGIILSKVMSIPKPTKETFALSLHGSMIITK
jgi:hypothetical protein